MSELHPRRLTGFTARVSAGLCYIGQGNYWSGERPEGYTKDHDEDHDAYDDSGYADGRYTQGSQEQSQLFGGNGFGTGQGPFGSLQRQYENRFVAGGHRGSCGDRFGYSGPENRGSKLHPTRGQYWHNDTGTRRLDEHAYYDETGDPTRRAQAPARSGAFIADAFSGASDWDSAPDNTDPRGFVIFAIEDRRPGRPARRGPNGHRRSDERLLAAIYQQILSTHHIDAGDVSIEVHKRRATLTGSVPERWMRHAIDSLVDRTPDVHYVHNRIRVRQLLEVPGMDWHEESPLSYSSAGS